MEIETEEVPPMAAEKVQTLRTIDHAVNQRAVELVETLLERLKNGSSVAVGYFEVGRGGSVRTAYADTDDGNFHYMNSGAHLLASRFLTDPGVRVDNDAET
ncbi:hypothetical protein [Hyphomicrobium sp.]|uniref:hypothetical protein n=1 Tax=Hyphomicrobium sp. TaxID=82 RepID=UPI001D20771E|nr:hypothetical protein [Hyphomicrobium sp.]MBY0559888.1 hypothetical protein [Hyphomicrobium sp.]